MSFIHFFKYMMQTFIETPVCYNPSCIRSWKCKTTDISPDFDKGVYSPSRETKGNVGNVLTCGRCYALCL